MIANSWPTEYTLKFKADRSIYLLGACVTETDRQFYSPKLKYVLKLKDGAGKLMSDGAETFIKKTSNKIEGGLPKALDYGPHDITFKNPSHINKNQWYELSLSIANVEAPWNKYPLIVCKCKDQLTSFGVGFTFAKSYEFKEEDRAIFDLDEDVESERSSSESEGQEEEEIEGAVGGRVVSAVLDKETKKAKKSKEAADVVGEDDVSYGLISRLYFYY